MADEAQGDGSIESAVAQLQEARQEAVKPEIKEIIVATNGADVATEAATEEMPEQPEAAGDDIDPVEEDAGQAPPIDPPARWTAEDKEWFKTLPPERQERILRGEQGQRSAEVKRQQELEADRRAAQEAREAAAQERQYFSSVLQQYKNPLVSSYQQRFADVLSGEMDVLRLSQDQPRWNEYQAYQAKFAQIAQQEQMLAQRAKEDADARLELHIEARNNQLIEAMPELKDPKNFEKFENNICGYLLEKGIPAQRIRQAEFVDLEIAYDAMRWRDAQKAKATVPRTQTPPGQVAVQGHIRSVPKVLKPGMGSSAGGGDEKITAIDQRARQSGSVDDAAERLRLRRLQRRA